MMVTATLLLFFFCLVILTSCDEKVYIDSSAAYFGNENIDLHSAPIVHSTLHISNDQYASSSDSIYVTFIGRFSNSGPHLYGAFARVGERYEFTTQLDREIGDLQALYLENQGHDGVLISDIQCRIKEKVFEIDVKPIWIERYDSTSEESDGNGNSPEADIDLPSSSTVMFPVKSSYFFYDFKGIYTKD